MTKFKCELKNVEVKEVNKNLSKKGNAYLVLKTFYNNEELNLYYPNFDTDIDFEILKGIHDLELEISISKYSSVKILRVK